MEISESGQIEINLLKLKFRILAIQTALMFLKARKDASNERKALEKMLEILIQEKTILGLQEFIINSLQEKGFQIKELKKVDSKISFTVQSKKTGLAWENSIEYTSSNPKQVIFRCSNKFKINLTLEVEDFLHLKNAAKDIIRAIENQELFEMEKQDSLQKEASELANKAFWGIKKIGFYVTKFESPQVARKCNFILDFYKEKLLFELHISTDLDTKEISIACFYENTEYSEFIYNETFSNFNYEYAEAGVEVMLKKAKNILFQPNQDNLNTTFDQ